MHTASPEWQDNNGNKATTPTATEATAATTFLCLFFGPCAYHTGYLQGVLFLPHTPSSPKSPNSKRITIFVKRKNFGPKKKLYSMGFPLQNRCFVGKDGFWVEGGLKTEARGA